MKKLSLINRKFWAVGIIALSLGLTVSCKKTDSGNDQETGAEAMRGFLIDLDCFPEEVYASNTCGLNLEETIAPGAVITESSTNFPKTVTFDYGTGCQDQWGRTRKGKVIVTVTGDMAVQGSTTTVNFVGFSVNDISIDGERFSENIGLNGSGNNVIHYTAKIVSSKGDRSREHSIDHNKEWVSGSGTCDVHDDEFHITGNGIMTTCHGRQAEMLIEDAIHYKMRECKYPLSGKINIGSKRRGVYIDFGNGECDKYATVTVKRRNRTHQIDLETREIIK